MSDSAHVYPIRLDRQEIADLLPHRGDIFVCRSLVIEGPHQYSGVASWPLDNGVIRGHFPGLPLVPGVMLIETMAQLAGAGLLAGDPYVKTLPSESVGVLAAVRNCWFKNPVKPETEVTFSIKCRQMAPLLVQVSSQVSVDALEVARLEVAMAYVPRDQLFSPLAGQTA
jgi:3-hydroxyacyl-[acyl-carrier-protein] dehydratase